MHSQPLFVENRPSELQRLMRAHPLATLVIVGPQGAQAQLLPLQFVPGAPHGRLLGHIARGHPFHTEAPGGSEALVIFQGPNAYISPRWYVNGQKSGRNAPSWNYTAVQARGPLRWIDDRDWLLTHLGALTAEQEAEREAPWSLHETAADVLDNAARRLIGFEIEIAEIAGKRFLSQQRTEADRRSVIEHLSQEPRGMARDLASWIEP